MAETPPQTNLVVEFGLDCVILAVDIADSLTDDLDGAFDLHATFDGDGFFDNTEAAVANLLAEDVRADFLALRVGFCGDRAEGGEELVGY